MPRPSIRRSLLAATLLVATSASAEPLPSINLRGFSPPPGPRGGLYLEPVSVPGHLQYNLAGWVSWAYRPLVARRDGVTVSSLVSQQTSLDLGGSIGLGKRLELGLTLPIVAYQGGDESAEAKQLLGDSKIPAQAIGDATLAIKGILKPIVDEEFGGFGLAAVGRVGLPTGSRESTLGEGAFTTEARLLAEMRLVGFSFQGTAGFKVRTDERTFGGKTWGNEIPWGAGMWLKPQMFGVDPKGAVRLGIEAHGALPAGPDAPFSSKVQTPAYVGAHARYSIRDLHLLLGAEAGVSQAAGSAPVRAVLGANWAPRDHDLDKDGIEDEVDECPKYPEDRDGFKDNDGCPEPDNDEDNVVDAEDKCPLEPEDEDEFDDEDGCPDPDNDKDGILDGKDACPNEAGPASPSPEKNGCPIRDPDGDGVEGEADECPDQPEDKDGFEDDDGCPDLDNDEDGVADKDDRCPDQKGEASLVPELNGCPSPDRDNDAIPNEADKCPDQPENYNGFEDDDGCPDAPRGKPKPLVDVTERRGQKEIALAAAVRFVKGSTDVDPRSAAQLRALSQRLIESPAMVLSIAVRPAPADGGDDLARRRTEALVALLVKQSRRPGAAVAVPWTKGKMPASAEVKGVAVMLPKP